jgi:hypothetical protein
MIIQTFTCEFLIEKSDKNDGSVAVYSNSLEEIQRFFGSLEIEFLPTMDWKYKVCTCKQDLSNVLIHMVKEIDYSDFPLVHLK